MIENSGKNGSDECPGTEQHSVEDETLVELRHLLISPVEDQVDRIQVRLDDPQLRSAEVASILPDAVRVRSAQDDALVSSLSPTIEQALRLSIRNNLKSFADALFPVIGPAIRKAISEALRGMVQSLNEAMDKSFSLKGLKWRFEAYRAKKPFSEIVILHSIIYRVEQVFLIHKKTGLLLKHLVKDDLEFQDADMVSGMLTAIRDFVADSFSVEEGEGLESILVGELNVWIEHGPEAILALVIRGNAPATLRSVMKEALERIHVEFGAELQNFDGDTAQFESTSPILETCLVSRYVEDKKKTSPILVATVATLTCVLAVWTWVNLKEHFRWQDLLVRLNALEGIVVTQAQKEDGNYVIRGLRDGLSFDPDQIVAEVGINPQRVTFHWTPYQALTDEIVLKRANKMLTPGETVTLTLKQGVLSAHGKTDLKWLLQARNSVKNVTGVDRFDTNSLTILDKSLHDSFMEFLRKLRAEKGVVITSYNEENGKFSVSGLLDPFAVDPRELLRSSGLDESQVNLSWEPYQSSDIYILLKRIRKLLNPPETVKLEVSDNCIQVSGAASNDWLLELRGWLKTVPVSPCLKYKDLLNLDYVEMENLKREIQSQSILFKSDTNVPTKGQFEKMEVLAGQMRRLVDLSKILKVQAKISIHGHTDQSGTAERNKNLSQQRAERIMEFLVSRGVPIDLFSLEALGATKPISHENTEPGLELNRRVAFEVAISQK